MQKFLESTSLWLPGLIAMVSLICGSGFFSGSETALFYLSHDELRKFRHGKPREQLVADLLQNADRLLTAVLFWNLLINLTYFSISIFVAQELMRAQQRAAAVLFGVGSLIAIIVLGEVLPKSVAVVFRRRIASSVSIPLVVAVRILDPVAPFFSKLTRGLRRMFWPHVPVEPYLQTENLEQAIENSEMSDEVIRYERQVLHNILDMSEITVEEVMRPRGSYSVATPPINLDAIREEGLTSDYVAINEPGTEDVDRVISLARFTSVPQENLHDAAEEVAHVPWCANLAFTLQTLRERFCSVAAVIDEYGSTIGIVTFEDIVDTIIAPQPSRARRLLQRDPILEIAPARYHVDGITTLRYLCTRLELEYKTSDDGQLTVAGLLHDELEHIPVVGDECTWRGFRFKVIDVADRGQLRVMVSRE